MSDIEELGWLEELESSFTGSQPAALPYKLQPHVVARKNIERTFGLRVELSAAEVINLPAIIDYVVEMGLTVKPQPAQVGYRA